jgi:DNA repair exonuclease SbcCD ATPase subunit
MKISALRLFNVKRFANRGVAIEGIGDGVNVLCAANEFGKSTSFEALHALFFQRHSGTPEAVRKLRPYSGGNPLIEADIVTGAGSFRIAKQYYGGGWARIADLSSGRLLAQADEAENFIAGLVNGGSAGPAGLLWVRQGITGIEKRSTSEEEGEKQVRRSLLESVQGEVEAVTGGRRMAEIMAAAEKTLSDLVTATGKPKTGGPYLAAIHERDRLAAAEAKLAGEVESLRDALDKRVATMKRLAELDHGDERQDRRLSVEKAQAAFDAAKAHSEKLRTVQAELQLASERRVAADTALSTFQKAIVRAKSLRESLAEAEQRRIASITRRRDAAGAIDKARAAAEAAEAEEREARDLLSRLDAALKAKVAFEELAALKSRLADADAIRTSIEELEATLAHIAIAPEAIASLQELEIEIARLRAVEEAARPSISIIYEPEAATQVSLAGAALADGEERGYDGGAQLFVPGVATITLRSSQRASGNGKLDQLETKRRELLATMGVDGLAQARERQVRAQELTAQMREARARLSMFAPDGVARLREEVAARDVVRDDKIELKADPEQVRLALAGAEHRKLEARQTLREAEPQRASADEAFVVAETGYASLQGELAQVAAVLGEEAQQGEREAVLQRTLASLERDVAALEAKAAELLSNAVDLETAEAALKRARSVEAAAESEIATLREAAAGLNVQIRTVSEDAVEEKWRETGDALVAAQARVTSFEKEVAVLQKLGSALGAARSKARELYLQPVVAELKPLLSLLFDDVAISFDDKSLLPETITRNGHEEDVDRLSGGMREQLSILTRLAFARLLAKDGSPAPVILDDALVYSDDDRIERMFDALHRQARDQQIIIFSCRQRAFQKLGGNVLRMTDWQP